MGQCIESNDGTVAFCSVQYDGRVSRQQEAQVNNGIMYLARPDAVVFDLIDMCSGASGISPSNFGPMAFTNHDPVFDVVVKGIVRPVWTKALCRTPIFHGQVEALVVGSSGRRRVSVEVFVHMRHPRSADI